ncbi:MAG: DUF3465 domain-containing protein [Gammaproteobacteria bacterium]
MKKLVIVIALAVLAYQFATRDGPTSNNAPSQDAVTSQPEIGAAQPDALTQAYDRHESNVQVQSEGVVAKLLKDDDSGSRHQRMIVRLPSGHTILIAHNIDLAPRVQEIAEGDTISFAGEYEWNDKGGVVHWTHRDPSGQHVAGWIKHAEQIYQ